MLRVLLLGLTGVLAGCAASHPRPPAPTLTGAYVPHPPLPPATTAVDCTEAERRARAIAEEVTMRYDLAALTQNLRAAIARAGSIGNLDVTAMPLDEGWTYHGDGSLWFFRSGAWTMTIDNDGAGPIHLRGTDAQRQEDACVDATWRDGRMRFSAWRTEAWVYINFGCILEIDYAPVAIDCNFAIPVPAP